MGVNYGRVVAGGLAAGVVMNVFDFLNYSVLMKDRMTAEMNAVAPGLADKMMAGGAATMTKYVVMDFILGIALIWLYAAIRPRFGAGVKTAAIAGIFFWILGLFFTMPWLQLGLMSGSSFLMVAVVSLVDMLVAAAVGGMVYKEGPATAAAMA